MKMKKYLLLAWLTFHWLAPTHAQDRRFIAGLLAGFNASQIDGDNASGFHKAGLFFGLRGGYRMSERMGITMDLTYSQRGSRRVPNQYETFDPYFISTTYAEVPVMFYFKDWLVEGTGDDDSYYKVGVALGPEVSFLIKAKAENSGFEGQVENFNKTDIGWTAGISYYFSPRLGITARYLRSFTLLYNNKKHNQNLNKLLGYNFNFSLSYVL